MVIAYWHTKQNIGPAPGTSLTKQIRTPLPMGSFLAQNLQMNYTTHTLNADMPPDEGTMALHVRSSWESMNIKQVPLVLFSKLFRGTELGLDSLQDRRASS